MADCKMIRGEIEANNAKPRRAGLEGCTERRHRRRGISDLARLVRDGLERRRRSGCRHIAAREGMS
jgi:hypothetical protein